MTPVGCLLGEGVELGSSTIVWRLHSMTDSFHVAGFLVSGRGILVSGYRILVSD